MPGGLWEVISIIVLGYLARKSNRRMFFAVVGELFSLFGISLMMGLSRSGTTAYPVGQLIGYYLLIGSSPGSFVLVLSFISSNSAGYTKKTTVNAVCLIGYSLGFIIGPQTYRDSPNYPDAKWTIVAVGVTALLMCVCLYCVNLREDRRRDKLAADLPPEPEGLEFRDLTDKENPYFRYAL